MGYELDSDDTARRDRPPGNRNRQMELLWALGNVELWAARSPDNYTTGFALAILYAQEIVRLRRKGDPISRDYRTEAREKIRAASIEATDRAVLKHFAGIGSSTPPRATK